jgi:hypothetical protein
MKLTFTTDYPTYSDVRSNIQTGRLQVSKSTHESLN